MFNSPIQCTTSHNDFETIIASFRLLHTFFSGCGNIVISPVMRYSDPGGYPDQGGYPDPIRKTRYSGRVNMDTNTKFLDLSDIDTEWILRKFLTGYQYSSQKKIYGYFSFFFSGYPTYINF